MKLSFGQKDSPIRGSFWPKDSLISHILFELCLFRYLAQSTSFWDTLYLGSVKEYFKNMDKVNKRHYYFTSNEGV